MDLEKIGKRIASLRKERGYTGEALAERLHVSPQAVSKWENARCLPETGLLPALAEALDCSIDSLLCPREFFILEAFYTDGQTKIPVTQFLNGMVRDNGLNIHVNEMFLGVSLPGERLKVLTVKYQTPEGSFFSYALQDADLILNKESVGFSEGQSFQIIGAWYGNERDFSSAMQKLKHYEYFHWDSIPVNQETFPSASGSDDTEYLTLVYLNREGIHVISCPENGTLYYGNRRTSFFLADHTKCILKGIQRLSWGEGMDCPWAGALYAALRYMGESWTYDQIMGMSGACWRVCFTDVWDYSCTDALVAFDYATPLFKSLGYAFRMADRVAKHERKAERLSVMEDIRNGKPVLAINLRVAPEWGVITGYVEDGARFLCRTYFDQEIFDDLEQHKTESDSIRHVVFEENEGYLFNDFWPFLLLHFEEKTDMPSPGEALKTSLLLLTESFRAKENRGYYQGKEAYTAWMEGLAKEEDFRPESDRENVQRRLSVNDSMLCCLIDARRAAASYLEENINLIPENGRQHLEKIAENCREITRMFSGFREKISGAVAKQREAQISLLEKALTLEEENCRLAGLILELPQW